MLFFRFRRSQAPFIFVCAWLAVVSISQAALAESTGPRSGQWAHESTSLAPDPRVTWGRLPNGVRYALLPHAGVPGRVSMRMVMLSGSIDEKDTERGIAHFTEHMVFRGTRRFKYDQMVSFFQKLGMEYGSDVNAVTTFDYTAYMLDYRENDPDLLKQGVMLLRDFADSAEFASNYIDRERGVILSEMRLGAGVMGENSASYFPVVFKGMRLQDRNPIGIAKQIQSFTREQFLEFYRRCYRPDLAIVVVVGDIDANAMTQMITEEFGAIAARTDSIPERDEGRLDTRRALRAGIFKISDVGGIEVLAASVTKPKPEPDTREKHAEQQRRSFAFELLSERISQTLPGKGEAGYDTLMGLEIAQAQVRAGPDDWDAAVTGLDEVVRATYERGFTAKEVEQLKRHRMTLSTFLIEQAATMDPAGLIDMLVDSITKHRVFLGFEENWRVYFEWLGKVKPDDVLASFRSAWDLDRMAFHISGEVDIKGGENAILKRVADVRKGRLRTLRMDTRESSDFRLLSWGSASPVVERKDVPELYAHLFRFGNNVHLNYVPRRAEPGLVQAVVRVGTGIVDMPGDQPALKEFGLRTLLASGAGRYTSEQVGEIVSDHMLGFSFDLEDHDAFAFRGYTRTEDFKAFLGVVTEFLYKPRFETYVHRSQKMMGAIQRAMGGLGIGQGIRELDDHLFKGDPRFTWGTINNYLGMSVLDVRNWLLPPLTSGYVEITVVGDIGENELINLVSRTLGALPIRNAVKSMSRAPAPVKVTAPAGFQRIEFVGEQHQGVVIGTWPVEQAPDVRDGVALHTLGRILDIRIREQVRDNLGLAYSPMTEYSEYEGFTGFGLLQTTIDCAPEESTRIAELITAIADDVAKNGVGEGEFEGCLGIFKSQIRRAFRSNGFLLEYMKRAQENPSTVDDLLAAQKDLLDTVTLDQVNSWARKILPASNSRAAAIVPKPFIGIFQTGR